MRPIDDPEYLAAQIDCLRSLLFVMAGLSCNRLEFRHEALAALDRLRVATLNLPTSDARLLAIDATEKQVKSLTE